MSNLGNIKSKSESIMSKVFMLPYYMIVIVMPFIIKVKEYDSGYGVYDWHAEYAIEQDLYCFYRSRFFIVSIIVTMLLLLGIVIYCLYKKIFQCIRLDYVFFVVTVLFALWAFISARHSINQEASLKGNYYSFQSLIVVIGYIVLCLYTLILCSHKKMEKELFNLLGLLLVFEIIWGYLEILGADPIRYELIQKIILGKKYVHYLGGLDSPFTSKYISLSFMNPNQAGTYLAIMSGMVLYIFLKVRVKKLKFFYGVILVLSLPLQFFTYSRGSLLAFVSVGIVLILLKKDDPDNRVVKVFLLIGVLLFFMLILYDVLSHGRFSAHLFDDKVKSNVDEMYADQFGIHIKYDGQNYDIEYDGERFVEKYNRHSDWIKKEGYYLDDPSVVIVIDEMEFVFIYDGNYYFYYTQNGKITTLDRVDHINMFGLEYIGSGRLYIWSRLIPRIGKFWLYGSGLDTFPEVFPQDDYVGKYIYSGDPNMIIENAHNMYLGIFQTLGVPALLLFLIAIIRTFMVAYKNIQLQNKEAHNADFIALPLVGIVIYLICGLFYDNNLFVTPLLSILLGILSSKRGNFDETK